MTTPEKNVVLEEFSPHAGKAAKHTYSITICIEYECRIANILKGLLITNLDYPRYSLLMYAAIAF